MKNIKLEIKENKLMIEVDLTKNFGFSKSGKTTIIASSQGNQPISTGDDVVYLGLNIYKK